MIKITLRALNEGFQFRKGKKTDNTVRSSWVGQKLKHYPRT